MTNQLLLSSEPVHYSSDSTSCIFFISLSDNYQKLYHSFVNPIFELLPKLLYTYLFIALLRFDSVASHLMTQRCHFYQSCGCCCCCCCSLVLRSCLLPLDPHCYKHPCPCLLLHGYPHPYCPQTSAECLVRIAAI